MTRKILFILLAVVLTILELFLKAIIDALLGWKSGGGAIPMVLFIGLIVMTWKACLKWGKGKETTNTSEPLSSPDKSKADLPTNVKVKKFIAKEILIALSIAAIYALTVLIFKWYEGTQEALIDNHNPDNYDNLGILEQQEFNKAQYTRNKPYYDNISLASTFCETLLLSVIIFVYPVRILFFLIKWCIKTLKT